MDPWASDGISDYDRLIKKFGIEPFDSFRIKYDSFRYVRRGIVFGHRDFGKISEALDNSRPFAMMTGLMPSGCFHLGHKMVADQMIWLQSLGAKTFICAADIESYLMRDMPFEMAKNIAIKEYLANYLALGLKKKNLTFWFQSDYIPRYYRLRDMASKRVTFNELCAIYGEVSPAKITSALTQVADILHPQLDFLCGPIPTVVPVGADQDPHIRLTRDIASRLSAKRPDPKAKPRKGQNPKRIRDMPCIPPCATYHKFMSGLSGGKMSSSDAKSHIALSDEPQTSAKKIMQAKTGGRKTAKEQKLYGGKPSECSIYELYLYHLVEDDLKLSQFYHECTSGSITCGDCKKRCSDMILKMLIKHGKRLKKAGPAAERMAEK